MKYFAVLCCLAKATMESENQDAVELGPVAEAQVVKTVEPRAHDTKMMVIPAGAGTPATTPATTVSEPDSTDDAFTDLALIEQRKPTGEETTNPDEAPSTSPATGDIKEAEAAQIDDCAASVSSEDSDDSIDLENVGPTWRFTASTPVSSPPTDAIFIIGEEEDEDEAEAEVDDCVSVQSDDSVDFESVGPTWSLSMTGPAPTVSSAPSKAIFTIAEEDEEDLEEEEAPMAVVTTTAPTPAASTPKVSSATTLATIEEDDEDNFEEDVPATVAATATGGLVKSAATLELAAIAEEAENVDDCQFEDADGGEVEEATTEAAACIPETAESNADELADLKAQNMKLKAQLEEAAFYVHDLVQDYNALQDSSSSTDMLGEFIEQEKALVDAKLALAEALAEVEAIRAASARRTVKLEAKINKLEGKTIELKDKLSRANAEVHKANKVNRQLAQKLGEQDQLIHELRTAVNGTAEITAETRRKPHASGSIEPGFKPRSRLLHPDVLDTLDVGTTRPLAIRKTVRI